MYVLLLPLLLLLFLIVGVISLIKKKFVIAIAFVCFSFILNYMTETYAFKSAFRPAINVGKRIRIMSYNIHNNGVYFDKTPDGIDSLMAFVKKESPDIIFLTEYWKYRRPELAAKLHELYPYCSAYVFDKPDHTDFFLCSRFPVSNVHRFEKRGLKQMLVHGVDVDIDGRKIKLIGCHLQSNNLSKKQKSRTGGTYWDNLKNGYEMRQRQVERIRDSVASYDCPLIVMGDMNDISGSYTLRTLKQAGLKDAWWERGLGYGATYVALWIGWRLDHIMCSKEFEVGKVSVFNVPYSDHKPILADLYMTN